MLRAIFALCAGLFAAMIVYTISAAIAQQLWPPTGVDLRDPGAIASFVASLPTGARLTLLCGPVLGAFVGAGVAANTAVDWTHVGHPAWMLAAGIVLVLLASLLAALLVRKAWPAPGR